MTEPPSTITFEFCGKTIPAQSGDSIASALYRSGQRIFTRSFKYHRPRGLLCLSGKCPNCLMNVDGVPNVRVCVNFVRSGMRVRPQNVFPSLERDWLAIVQRFDWLMPVGWYYKALTHRWTWKAAEPFIRKIAGLGEPPPPGVGNCQYEHSYRHTEVAIIGGGPAGLERAVELGSHGEQVALIDDQPELGGHLRYSKASEASVAELIRKVHGLPAIEVMQGYSCFGLYEGNLLGIVRPNPHAGAREQLMHLRARRIVVATGTYEAPFVFRNNDLVGIMLSTAVERLIRLHGVKPGRVATVIGGGARAQEVAALLQEAEIPVAAIIAPEAVVAAAGKHHVKGIQARDAYFSCDLVVVCGPRVPNAGLLTQAGGRLEWDASKRAFLPVDLPLNVAAVGEVAGEPGAASPLAGEMPSSKRAFVCLCSDVTSKDLKDAIDEGFNHIETLKRYTTATMGPCQGRMCQLSTISICARETNRSIGETGITTARPPNPSVTLGALAGARHHPIRRTPVHYEHDALGAVWMEMGEWKRPRFYRTPKRSDEKRCIEAEYRAVRERVGLIDVSTLGKLDVKGRDAGKLLDKVYAGRLSDLRTGRVRYSVLCDEAGVILDDGTVLRLADDHYFLTTTTGNLEFVDQWLKWWSIGSGWDVHITNLTGGLAAVNLAGPRAREVLSKLTDRDLSTKAFSYMSCHQGKVAEIEALLVRIGFVGETGWEIHCPAESGVHLWRALLDAGREFDILPFGVEAQRLLRLEKRHVIVGVDTDALTNPFEAGLGWVAKLDKEDFVGRAALCCLESKQRYHRLVGFVMNEDALPEDGAAILVRGKLSGRVTSVRYSPVNHRAVGMAWVPAEHAQEGVEVDVRVGGRLARARVTQQAFYDPEGARLRR